MAPSNRRAKPPAWVSKSKVGITILQNCLAGGPGPWCKQNIAIKSLNIDAKVKGWHLQLKNNTKHVYLHPSAGPNELLAPYKTASPKKKNI